MKTTIDLPDPLFRRVKATAAVNGLSLKSFITQAVEQSLNTPKNDWRETIANLPRVPKETLETIRQRIEESDLEDLHFQKQANDS
jgi:predicted DNA binding CopG/RHH family protein